MSSPALSVFQPSRELTERVLANFDKASASPSDMAEYIEGVANLQQHLQPAQAIQELQTIAIILEKRPDAVAASSPATLLVCTKFLGLREAAALLPKIEPKAITPDNMRDFLSIVRQARALGVSTNAEAYDAFIARAAKENSSLQRVIDESGVLLQQNLPPPPAGRQLVLAL